ncbi:MAG: S-layer homology domain-containing protein, partial [Acidimicrobiales bacterium]|nr:S-layer homology domain-containing protein [Acidimicrobiales bacterium]
MFGITSGTTATTYSPADPVSRWQMALFLSRMYTPVGLTAGTGTFTAFTDIGDLSSEIQTAINA